MPYRKFIQIAGGAAFDLALFLPRLFWSFIELAVDNIPKLISHIKKVYCDPESKFFFWLRKKPLSIYGLMTYIIVISISVCIYLDYKGVVDICEVGGGSAGERSALLSSLLTSLVTVFALTITVIFITNQIAVANYSVRITGFQFRSLHFIGMVGSYYITIIFIILALAREEPFFRGYLYDEKIAVISSIWCFLLLVPFALASARNMMPRYLVRNLCEGIFATDFDEARIGTKKHKRLILKIQPLFDMVRSAAKRDDLNTIQIVFDGLRERFGEIIIKTTKETRSLAIAEVVGGNIRDLGFHARNREYWDILTDVLETLAELIALYGRAKKRAAGREVYQCSTDLWCCVPEADLKETDPRAYLQIYTAYNKCMHNALEIF